MVRVNLFSPEKLSDQHLIAEYNEILMLVVYLKKHPFPENQPKNYCLGKGHMKFFACKLKYLKKRHNLIRKEMKNRGFITRKKILLSNFTNNLISDWRPKEEDFAIIRKRIVEKLRLKKDFYRYYGEKKPTSFFVKLLV